MRTIALFVLTLTAAGCVTSRQVVRVDSEPRGAALSVECDGVSRGSGHTPGIVVLSRRAQACSVTLTRPGGSSHQQAEALGGGVLLAGIFLLGDEVTGARAHFEPELLDVRLDRAAE